MADQNQEGARNNEITRLNSASDPVREIRNPNTTTIVSPVVIDIPFWKRGPAKLVFGFAVIVGVVAIIAGLTEIPNNVMGWYINVKTLRGTRWFPPEIPAGYKTVTVAFGELKAAYDISILENKHVPFAYGFDKGTNGADLKINTAVVPGVEPGGFVPITLTIVKRRLYINCKVPCRGAEITIQGNNPKEEIPQDWDWNANENAVEIVDEKRVPVLQIVYVRPEKITICGHFIHDGVSFQVSTGARMKVGGAFYDPNFIKPLFKYPSGLHKDQLAE